MKNILILVLMSLWITTMALPINNGTDYNAIIYYEDESDDGKELDLLRDVEGDTDNLEAAEEDDGEIMETANRVVFTPLFRYRKRLNRRTGYTRRYYNPYRGYYFG